MACECMYDSSHHVAGLGGPTSPHEYDFSTVTAAGEFVLRDEGGVEDLALFDIKRERSGDAGQNNEVEELHVDWLVRFGVDVWQ